MKRLFLLMVFLAVSIQSDAAKMSSYTENTTPNENVYFIGVDPNDTTQTVNGSNYRYSINSIMGLGLIDAVFASLSVSGAGDSWIELNNNTTFSDDLTGKYGIRFYNGVLQQIINGTASALGSGVVDDTAYGVGWDGVTDEAPSKNAVYDKISAISAAGAPTIQANDPTIADATGWYLATTSGDAFYVVHGVGVFTMAGSYAGDETDPVVGDVAPSALTHDGTGATLTATIASVTEANEDDREWSLYNVTDASQGTWTVFTGLSISGIAIPADTDTYRLDVRCTDLAGNVGTASSSNIVYSAGVGECGTPVGDVAVQSATGVGVVGNSTLVLVGPYTSPETCTVSNINFGFSGLSGTENVTLGIYSESGGTYTLVADTAQFTGNAVNELKTVALDSATEVTTGTNYYIAVAANSTSAFYPLSDGSPDGDGGAISVGVYTYVITYSAGTLPASVTGVTTVDATAEVYAYAD